MALTIPEREATRILFREYQKRGTDEGLQNFARVVLGAHAEQARRLTDTATSLDDLSGLDDVEFAEDAPNFKTDREGNRATYEGPITDADQLMDVLGFNPEHYYIKKGGGSAWGQVGDQKLSVRAEFELKEYDFLRDVDRAGLIEELSAHAPEYPQWDLPKNNSGKPRLLEIMVADLHADKLAEGYSLEVARRRFVGAVREIAEKASHTGFSKSVLVLNGDTFNWDHAYKTTKGTPQDSSVPGHLVFSAVRSMIVEATDLLRAFGPVEVIILRGNHDYEKSAYLSDTLYSWYSKDDRVDVVLNPEDRTYVRWGVNLIGLTHGAEERKGDLPMLMMRENDVRGCEVFEWHLGHVHSAASQESQGVLLRWFRTPSNVGAWGDKKGYGHNVKEIVGIVWHREKGKDAEYPVQFL